MMGVRWFLREHQLVLELLAVPAILVLLEVQGFLGYHLYHPNLVFLVHHHDRVLRLFRYVQRHQQDQQVQCYQ